MKFSSLVIYGITAMSFACGAQSNVGKSKTEINIPVITSSQTVLGSMSATERRQLSEKIINQWSGYVKEVYGTDPQVWAKSMAGTLASADPMNLRQAAKRTTYEGMAAVLLGRGTQTSDEDVINTLAKSSSNPERVGDLTQDLVYTMITPCRILDTRSTVEGALGAGATRSFVASNPGQNFSVQGGSATDCSIPADPAAVVMNVTVVTPATGGYLTVFPAGEALPLASSLNYAVGDIRANEIIVKQTQLQASDFSIYSTASTHIVADVVGYFIAPVATALDCYGVPSTRVDVLAGKTANALARCPADFAVTGGSCTATPGITPILSAGVIPTAETSAFWSCSFANTTGTNGTATANAMCCRAPGR